MNTVSLNRLRECHPDLVKIMLGVDEIFPIHVICGSRNKKDQNEAFKRGQSRVKYPDSKHNAKPLSLAVDVVPGSGKVISWTDLKPFEIMCLTIESIADKYGIKIKLGRDFKTLKDWPHVELI